jgi:hypothetical protein
MPLREGGSLPGVMEADDLGTYVVKFRGAGQGRKVLVAEVLVGGLARALGLPVPELVLVEVDPVLGRAEPDEEVQDLLRASGGLNLGMDFLPGALGFDPVAHEVEADLASRVLWFDALVGNVDRSWRNPNLLLWHRELQLIDHGATLVFHHDWSRAASAAAKPYDASDHVLEGVRDDRAAAGAGAWRRGRPRAARAGGGGRCRSSWLEDRARLDSADAVRAGTSTTSCAGRRAGAWQREDLRVTPAAGGPPGRAVGVREPSAWFLYCQAGDFLTVRLAADARPAAALDGGADVDGILDAAGALERTCAGEGPAAETSLGQRFRWLTAPRSTVVHAGPGAQRPDGRRRVRGRAAARRDGPVAVAEQAGNRRSPPRRRAVPRERHPSASGMPKLSSASSSRGGRGLSIGGGSVRLGWRV